MPRFSNGVTLHKCGNGGKYKRLRIKAGPLRDTYVDVLVLETKLGRPLGKGMTVEHVDGDALNVRPANLIEVTQSENSKLMHVRWRKAKQEDDEVPF